MPRPEPAAGNAGRYPQGRAYIYSTFNNTLISITDPDGNVIASASAGTVGFKGSRKGTAFAAQRAAEQAARRGDGYGPAADRCVHPRPRLGPGSRPSAPCKGRG